MASIGFDAIPGNTRVRAANGLVRLDSMSTVAFTSVFPEGNSMTPTLRWTTLLPPFLNSVSVSSPLKGFFSELRWLIDPRKPLHQWMDYKRKDYQKI